jgi:hypothetical protein
MDRLLQVLASVTPQLASNPTGPQDTTSRSPEFISSAFRQPRSRPTYPPPDCDGVEWTRPNYREFRTANRAPHGVEPCFTATDMRYLDLGCSHLASVLVLPWSKQATMGWLACYASPSSSGMNLLHPSTTAIRTRPDGVQVHWSDAVVAADMGLHRQSPSSGLRTSISPSLRLTPSTSWARTPGSELEWMKPRSHLGDQSQRYAFPLCHPLFFTTMW